MGIPLSLLWPSRLKQITVEFIPPKPEWSTEQIPDLTGKVAIVTGANTGLGFESARVLASHGATVYATARSEQKGMAAVEKINAELAGSKEAKPGKAIFLMLSLDDLKSIQAAVEEFKSKETRLDILMNNAGVMMPPEGTTSAGIDSQFATNVLGPFVVTRLLLPTLIHTAKLSENGTVRVVNISSLGHGCAPSGGIRFDDLSAGTPFIRYAQSKMGDLVFTKELARRYTDSGIISAAISPGNIDTGLWKHQKGLLTPNAVTSKYPVSYGILTQLYAATSPDVTKEDSGGYFRPWARRGEPVRDEANDPALGTKLWEWCEEQMKKEGITA